MIAWTLEPFDDNDAFGVAAVGVPNEIGRNIVGGDARFTGATNKPPLAAALPLVGAV